MDAASAVTANPATWAIPQPAPGTRTHALEAAASDTDLPQHISDLAERGELTAFLTQTDTAVALAGSAPVFAGQLDPLLDRIRHGLSQLPLERLPAVERDAVAATLERLYAHLGPVEGPAPSGEVPGGGLQAHEDAGGHLIERHVGKSEQALVDRVRSENISAASSFRDLPEAEHFVAATLTEHGERIDAWLGGEGGNRLVVDARFDASTGLSVARGESRAEDVFSVRLVLERSDRLDIGYRIVTGYPSAP
ncbi:RNase A-like domain-containing protein [Luteimonas suaedae]|uniref:RNase A-like domain-containing protein n=1 Tax=Luteimonas suaedae TaxID=2605430 RepID=UPI0016592C3A|nr:RNase A-like domain-containing protein [Luteimonas suaedae]